MESLERREVMAADSFPYYNSLIAADVDNDFMVTPLDALLVINRLNSQGSGPLTEEPVPGKKMQYLDVDRDNMLSPLDALRIINFINSGEGEITTESAEVRYVLLSVNPDGTAGPELTDPNPNNSIQEYVVGVGEKVIVRTQMRDLRPKLPGGTYGVFSAYHDIIYTNVDGSTDERLQVMWGDYLQIEIDPLVRGGSFTLDFGTENGVQRRAQITPAYESTPEAFLDPFTTAERIQASLEQVFGAGNIEINTDVRTTGTWGFGVHFVNDRARTDFPIPTVINNTLTQPNGQVVNVTLSGTDSPLAPSGSRDINIEVARDHNLATFYRRTASSPLEEANARYTGGPGGVLLASSMDTAARTLERVGGFANITSGGIVAPANNGYMNIVDVYFTAGEAGVVRLDGAVSALPDGSTTTTNQSLGVALFGNEAYLTNKMSKMVALPSNVLLTIIDEVSATVDVFSATEDVPITLDVMANDIDRLGRTLSLVSVTQPTSGGSVALNTAKDRVLFTPAPNANGPVIFTYTVQNTAGNRSTATVTVNVTPVNDPPSVVNVQFTTTEDIASPGLEISASQVFSAGPADETSGTTPQTVQFNAVRTTTTTNGTVQLVDGKVRYIPAADYFGTATFVVDGADSLGATTNNVTITVTVTAVNDQPTVVQSSFTGTEDTVRTITAASIFSPGPSNESTQIVTLAIVTAPSAANATAVINSSGSLVVTPAANFFGNVVVRVRGTDDGSPASSRETDVTINFAAVNDAPTAADDAFPVLATGDETILDVLANDSAGPGETTDTIRVTSVTAASRGTVRLVNGEVLYTAPTDAASLGQTATFTYTITDGGGLTDTATVEIQILPPASPFAVDDNYRTNTSLIADESDGTVVYEFDVLANDFSREPLTKTITETPTLVSGNGIIGLSGNKATFQPAADFFGEVVFEYTMDDDDDTPEENERRTATATILIRGVNDPPVAVNRSLSTDEDISISVNASTLNLSSGPGESDVLRFSSAVLQNTAAGTVAINDGVLVFTPARDSVTTAIIVYRVTDNGTPNLESNSATLQISINPINDPPVATNDNAGSVAEDTSLTIPISTLLSNDSPGPANEGQTLSFVAISGTVRTLHGTIRQITRTEGDAIVYTPDANYNGSDSFTYQISDGQTTNSTATGTVSLTVTEVNDAPIPTTITKSAFAGVATSYDLTTELAGMSRGAANESTQTLKIVRIIPGTDPVGTLTLNANGTLTYTAPAGASGQATFSYEIEDNGTTNGVADPKKAIGTINIDISPFIPSSFTGVVYVDKNSNGSIDPNEIRLGGVDVTLTIAADPTVVGSTSQTRHAVTRADGTYHFDLLPPGAYTVTYAVPYMSVDGSSPNSYSKTVVAPGNVNEVINFNVQGITPRYSSILDNLSINILLKDGTLSTKGIYAVVGADGKSEWTGIVGGFSGDTFHEVVLSDDGNSVLLTAVRGASHELFTATIPRSKFVTTTDAATGSKIVRIFATESDLEWQRVSLATPPIVAARKYMDAVDELFATEGW